MSGLVHAVPKCRALFWVLRSVVNKQMETPALVGGADDRVENQSRARAQAGRAGELLLGRGGPGHPAAESLEEPRGLRGQVQGP